MIIRRLLFGIPVVVGIVFLGAFLHARQNFDKKVNQLVLSSIGDAEVLNPVLSRDAASGDINGLVFNGLLRRDEDQNLIGDLAERWTVEQRSFLFLREGAYPSAEAAARELREALGEEMRKLQIRSIRATSPRQLELRLDTAGRMFEETLFRHLPRQRVEPIVTLLVSLPEGAQLPDGKKLTSTAFWERLRPALAEEEALRGRVLEHFYESSARLAVKAWGEKAEGALRRAVERAGRGIPARREGGKLPPAARVEGVEREPIDHEPLITFYLRKGVRWHDGHPFTSEDVRYTFEAIMDERTNTVRRPNYELVKRLEVDGPHVVKVYYKKPFSPSLDSWGIGILPAHLYRGRDINTSPYNRRPVGTGPFVFESWKADEEITLVANPDYYEGRPNLDRIAYRIIPEVALKELEFFVEGVDLDSPQPHQHGRYKEDPRFRLYSRLANGYTYIGWNQKVPLFRDVRVRTALTLAIDRKEIVEFLLYKRGVVSNGPFPPQMWYANPNVKPLPHDPARARRLLAEAGWKPGPGGILHKDGKPFRFTLMTNNGNLVRMNAAVLIQRQLREVGVAVNVELYEWSVFIREKIIPRNYEATVLGWALGLDPDVYEIWHSSQIAKGFNFTAYRNPEVDRLIELGRTEFDKERRKRIYQKLQELIHRDQPYTFLFVGLGDTALRRGAFKLRRPRREKVEEIRMTEMGVTYYLPFWFRVRGHEFAA